MPRVLRNTPIRSWENGDTVQGFALLTKKERREDRNGKGYFDLEIADASGCMVAKIWADSPAMHGNFETHRFVAFRGAVKSYRDQLQLSIDDCREATEDDRRFGFDESQLIPSTREDISDLWRRLTRILEEKVERPVLRRLARETLEIHGSALREHPAAKSMHHAYRGGLLEHVVSMAELALKICEHYRDVDRDLVVVGVLFHDIGKLRELGAMPANDYTLEGRLIGHVVIGRDILRDQCRAIEGFPEDLQLLLEHLVLSHQGKKEYASPVEPMTPEALVLHFVDDLDSKLNQLRASRDATPGIQYHRGLGRYVYLPALVERDEPTLEIDPHAAEALEAEAPPELLPDAPSCPPPPAGVMDEMTDEATDEIQVQPPLFRP